MPSGGPGDPCQASEAWGSGLAPLSPIPPPLWEDRNLVSGIKGLLRESGLMGWLPKCSCASSWSISSCPSGCSQQRCPCAQLPERRHDERQGKDPISKQGHILRFGVDAGFQGGTLFTQGPVPGRASPGLRPAGTWRVTPNVIQPPCQSAARGTRSRTSSEAMPDTSLGSKTWRPARGRGRRQGINTLVPGCRCAFPTGSHVPTVSANGRCFMGAPADGDLVISVSGLTDRGMK